jgi:hypothetical protein
LLIGAEHWSAPGMEVGPNSRLRSAPFLHLSLTDRTCKMTTDDKSFSLSTISSTIEACSSGNS